MNRELTEKLDAILERMFEAVESDRCDPLLAFDLWELAIQLDGRDPCAPGDPPGRGGEPSPDFQTSGEERGDFSKLQALPLFKPQNTLLSKPQNHRSSKKLDR